MQFVTPATLFRIVLEIVALAIFSRIVTYMKHNRQDVCHNGGTNELPESEQAKLFEIATKLVDKGRGILAADESTGISFIPPNLTACSVLYRQTATTSFLFFGLEYWHCGLFKFACNDYSTIIAQSFDITLIFEQQSQRAYMGRSIQYGCNIVTNFTSKLMISKMRLFSSQ